MTSDQRRKMERIVAKDVCEWAQEQKEAYRSCVECPQERNCELIADVGVGLLSLETKGYSILPPETEVR